jgi:hypothetical protein
VRRGGQGGQALSPPLKHVSFYFVLFTKDRAGKTEKTGLNLIRASHPMGFCQAHEAYTGIQCTIAVPDINKY